MSPIGADGAIRDGRVERLAPVRRARRRRQSGERCHDVAHRVAALGCPEVQHETRVARKTLGRRNAAQFRDEPRLSDAGVPADVDDRAGPGAHAGMNHRGELSQFADTSHERRRRIGVASRDERVETPRRNRAVDTLDRQCLQHRVLGFAIPHRAGACRLCPREKV